MIQRGEPWGHATIMTSETLVCGSDKALATSDQSKVLFLSGGDVAQSIGRPGQPGLGESCTEVTIDGDDLLILTSRDVLAIVEK